MKRASTICPDCAGALMRLPRTRDLRTWFFFDEVHALHRLPAIEDGLQTARGFGGAFAYFTKSATLATGSEGCATSTKGVRATRATGMKSFAGS